MRVLLLHNYYRSSAPSGENTVYESERELLRARGMEVMESTRSSDELAAMGAPGTLKAALVTPWNPAAVRAVRELIRKECPDVLHAHNTFPLFSPAVFRAARSTKTATVLTLHNYRTFCAAGIPMRDGHPCTLCLERRSTAPALRYGCYRNSHAATVPMAAMIGLHRCVGTWHKDVDAFIALTEFQRDQMVRAGLPMDRVTIKPHFYAAPPEPRPWATRGDRVVFLGRLGEEKGVRVLLDAWSQWGSEAPRLELVGEGPERQALEAFIRGKEVEGRVGFLGQVPFEEAQDRLAGARLLVLPSLCFEGFPMAIREALALGVPVAASRLGSMPCLIVDGRNGILFEPGSAEDLLEKVRTLWQAPMQLASMSEAARADFEAKYTAESNFAQLIAIYEKAIESRKRRNSGRLPLAATVGSKTR
jgi:glycosyltransferase involved in cell wall biosynthesis